MTLVLSLLVLVAVFSFAGGFAFGLECEDDDDWSPSPTGCNACRLEGFREGQQFERERIMRRLNPRDRRLVRVALEHVLEEDEDDRLDRV